MFRELMLKKYYRIILGKDCMYAQDCFTGGFVGVDYDFKQDFSQQLPDNWRAFNSRFIPVYLANHPGRSKITAGLACGMTWTVTKGMNLGDVVLSPKGDGLYMVGEVTGGYYYQPDGVLPHRRPVKWFDLVIDKAKMSDDLRHSAGAIGAVCELTRHSDEIGKFIAGVTGPVMVTTDDSVVDPYAFAMEKHLEDFLIKNWAHTSFGRDYKVYEENGAAVGQQYLTDTGPIDILAISKDRKSLLVIELKRGRASDVVVGQILRYMGYVKEELAEEDQEVRGVIIALEDDSKLRQALRMTPFIEFYRYEISFKLVRV